MAIRLGGKLGTKRYVSSVYVPLIIPELGSLVYISKTPNSFTLMYMPEGDGVLSLIATPSGSQQPTDTEFDFSLQKQTLTSGNAIQLIYGNYADPNKVTVWVQLITNTGRTTQSISLEYLLESIDSFFATNF